jgi:hypothetical protein
MRSTAAIVATLCLAGCSHASATPVNGPDGQPGWFAISCKKDQGNCEEKAGEVCPGGYVTADESGREGAVVVANGNSSGSWGYVVPTYHGHMLIKCKGAPAEDY